ncbi:stalk domain-containing protein [Paenibacillus thalictri]|uniref:S-layer protein n=1 Tax=Paenibacillus thalictri TaxID=2527873 RepID=A0A4Q9DM70_9BACL|nr:stalk domain-containing protein [Paenibacillus thalictri]TBL76367.1 S-layer protein [Paenibacillus thalictri]
MLTARRLAKRALVMIAALAIWCSGSVIPANTASAYSFKYWSTPNTVVGLTRPPIFFYLETDMPDTPSAYKMNINGEDVNVIYDRTQQTFSYTPTKDLAPGTYKVTLTFTYYGYEPIAKSWSFTVAKNALQQLPSPTSEQLSGLQAVNDYRMIYGLKPVEINDRLNASASAHANYLETNKVQQKGGNNASLHDEISGAKGFIGKDPFARANYYGYSSSLSEDAAYTAGTMQNSIDMLFDAPYHRKPFLDPNVTAIGLAKAGNYTVIEFGMGSSVAPQLVVSPVPGERMAPTTFKGYEEPDPLRIHKSNDYPVGYPIMAQYYGSDIEKVKLISAQLQTSYDKPIELLTNAPDNDDKLTGAVLLIPSKPLQEDTSYRVKLNLQITKPGGDTEKVTKEWDFTTEPITGIGKKKLHQDSAVYSKSSVTGSSVQRIASFGLDASDYTVDGVSFPMKRPPVIVDDSSYLYIRDLAAALGANVEWDDEKRAAVYTKGDLKVTLYTTKNQYEMAGRVQMTDTPARLVGENTMVPVRLLSEVLGAKINYTEATRSVEIIY